MDKAINPMMITVLLRFNGRVDYDLLITKLTEITRRYRRFRQRVILHGGLFHRPYWDDDPGLHILNHIERVELPLPAGEDAVEQLVNQKMNTPLDFNHPLWKVTLVDNHPDGSLLIVRVHHCIADGISLMQVLHQITTTTPEVSLVGVPAAVLNQVDPPPDLDPSIPSTMAQAMDRAEPAPVTTLPGIERSTPKNKHQISFRTPGILDMLAASVRIITRWADPPSILKGPLGQEKKAVWSEPYDVPEIKRIAQAKQATINDVMMAVSTGAIRRYIDAHHAHVKRNIRAFILVNMRGRSLDDELGNKFGLVFLSLPLDRQGSLERLEGTKSGMDSLKASAEYAATYLILNILGFMPEWFEDLAIWILDKKGTVVATNVPGARHQLYLAGAPIQSLIAWVPQSGQIGVGLSFISYNDQLIVGLNADAGLIPDPEVFLQLFNEEYQSLQETVF